MPSKSVSETVIKLFKALRKQKLEREIREFEEWQRTPDLEIEDELKEAA